MLYYFKQWLKKLPVDFTRNQRYDRLTKIIIRQHCNASSNCIDVGAHEGDFSDLYLKYAPLGVHFAFEPLPVLYHRLHKKYQKINNLHVFPYALSNFKGQVPFHYVTSHPAYSGIKKRNFDKKSERYSLIDVKADTLDNIIPAHQPVSFIKIDVEGGEMDVMEGAQRILANHHPLVVFEFGLGGSDVYGSTPEKMYAFLRQFNYQISLLEDYINQVPSLTLEAFSQQFYNRINYYFIAH